MPWLSLEGPCQSPTNTEAYTSNWTRRVVPSGGAGGWSRRTEGAYSSMGRTKILATQTPQDSFPPRFPFAGASVEPLPDQGPFLPLMPNKAFLCHIFDWNQVCPLVGGSVPRSPGASGWPKSLFFPRDYKPLQLLWTTLQLLHWGLHAESNC